MMIGRYQPWHTGHRELFKKVLALHPTGVVVGVRSTYGLTPKDPLTLVEVVERIEADLQANMLYPYQIVPLSDVQGIYYGRDVGYAVEKIELALEIQAISATQIRHEQRL